MRRIAVTGIGMISPVGNNVVDTWDAIKNGRSGVATIDSFDTSAFATKFSASIKGLDVNQYLSPKECRKIDPFIQYGMIAAMQAIDDAELEISEQNADRVGAVIGSGIGGLQTIEDTTVVLYEKGPKRVSPFFVPSAIINMIAGNLSIKYGFRGPNIAVTTACTTGAHSIGLAARAIRYGDADVMIAGGAEMGCTPLGLGGFSAARALSTRNDDPQTASRPWDRDRDGFVLGDGAGILILEELEHAKARGATLYAEVVGFGMSSDAHHITLPSKNGDGAALAMQNALRDARMDKQDIHYINAHGTSTPAGDKAECVAIKTVFGEYADNLAISSTKSMIGHLLGAAGAVESIFSILSIRDKVTPPTINHDHPDEGCDLNLVPKQAQEIDIDVAVCNSFGFGGTNGSLIFKRL